MPLYLCLLSTRCLIVLGGLGSDANKKVNRMVLALLPTLLPQKHVKQDASGQPLVTEEDTAKGKRTISEAEISELRSELFLKAMEVILEPLIWTRDTLPVPITHKGRTFECMFAMSTYFPGMMS